MTLQTFQKALVVYRDGTSREFEYDKPITVTEFGFMAFGLGNTHSLVNLAEVRNIDTDELVYTRTALVGTNGTPL